MLTLNCLCMLYIPISRSTLSSDQLFDTHLHVLLHVVASSQTQKSDILIAYKDIERILGILLGFCTHEKQLLTGDSCSQ